MRTVIVGASGQDGVLLTRLLGTEGDELALVTKSKVQHNPKVPGRPFSVTNYEDVLGLLQDFRPDRIFYLAGLSEPAETRNSVSSPSLSEAFLDVHVRGPENFLKGLSRLRSQAHFFFASSSEVFKPSEQNRIHEDSGQAANGLYASTKARGGNLCKAYREDHSLNVSIGYLFNHESALRRDGFLSRKIVTAALKAASGKNSALTIGNLNVIRDWGYAQDYVEAMRLISKERSKEDFIISSGVGRTVREFVELTYEAAQVREHPEIVEDSALLTVKPQTRVGDPSKIFSSLGWRSEFPLERLVQQLVHDYKALGGAVL